MKHLTVLQEYFSCYDFYWNGQSTCSRILFSYHEVRILKKLSHSVRVFDLWLCVHLTCDKYKTLAKGVKNLGLEMHKTSYWEKGMHSKCALLSYSNFLPSSLDCFLTSLLLFFLLFNSRISLSWLYIISVNIISFSFFPSFLENQNLFSVLALPIPFLSACLCLIWWSPNAAVSLSNSFPSLFFLLLFSPFVFFFLSHLVMPFCILLPSFL